MISSCTPNSRSSSSQQLQVGSASSVSSTSNKARAMYAKQGSACLLLQNAQVNSSGSLIPTPNLTKTGSKNSVCLKKLCIFKFSFSPWIAILEFKFSKKATRIWRNTYPVINVKSTRSCLQISVDFLENLNFTWKNMKFFRSYFSLRLCTIEKANDFFILVLCKIWELFSRSPHCLSEWHNETKCNFFFMDVIK